MKLKLFFSMMAVAAMTFTGCNKQTELEINYGRTARLQGKVTIFEETGASSQVASGIKVYAKVPYDILVTTETNNGGTSTTTANNTGEENDKDLVGYKTFEAKTNDQGSYSFDIPVTERMCPFEVYTERVELNDKLYYGKVNVEEFDNSINATTIKNIDMFVVDASEAVLIVKGKVELKAQPENLPAAGFVVEVEYSENNKVFTATTNAQGEFEINMPNNYAKITVSVPTQIVGGKEYSQYPNQEDITIGEDGKLSSPIVVEEITTEAE